MEHKPTVRITDGADTAVLMIHGILGTPRHFAQLEPIVPQSCSLYNILLDGHGRGISDFSKSSMGKWKGQVFALLEEVFLTHKQVVIVAHSMGTLFAIQAGIQHPERVKSLLLLGSPLRIHYTPRCMIANLKASLGIGAQTDPAVREAYRACSVKLSPLLWRYIPWIPRYLELFREIRYTRKVLPELTTPCLCYQSKHDELVSIRACKDLKDHPTIRLTVLENSRHYTYSPEDMALLQSSLQKLLQ